MLTYTKQWIKFNLGNLVWLKMFKQSIKMIIFKNIDEIQKKNKPKKHQKSYGV